MKPYTRSRLKAYVLVYRKLLWRTFKSMLEVAALAYALHFFVDPTTAVLLAGFAVVFFTLEALSWTIVEIDNNTKRKRRYE